jgi:DnaD/phage-associated family protein
MDPRFSKIRGPNLFMSKEAYYFSHDSNARNDEKILMLRAEHGMTGYGVYWILLEMMFESADSKLSLAKIKGIAVSFNVDVTLLKEIINTAISEQLFVSDGEKFWSESLIRRKEKFHDLKAKKSAAGKKGMAKRWGNKQIDNNVITDDNTVITKNNKGKESKEKESKEKENNIIAADNPFTFYENNFGVLSSFIADDLGQWIDELNQELVIRAMQKALEQNKRQWGYVKSILNDWAKNKFTTLEQVEAADLEFRNRNKKGEQQNGEHEENDEWSKAWAKKLERLKHAEPNF